MSENGDIRVFRTDQYRFRLMNRLFREPLIVLQMEEEKRKNTSYIGERWELMGKFWRDVTLEDLTIMSLNQLIHPKEGGEMPTCFRPHRKILGWCLILYVWDGAYKDHNWRPAKVQDLMIKDGKIQGGLGLVSR